MFQFLQCFFVCMISFIPFNEMRFALPILVLLKFAFVFVLPGYATIGGLVLSDICKRLLLSSQHHDIKLKLEPGPGCWPWFCLLQQRPGTLLWMQHFKRALVAKPT